MLNRVFAKSVRMPEWFDPSNMHFSTQSYVLDDKGLGWDTYNLISSIGSFILAAGILITIANVAHSYSRGRIAGRVE